MNDPPQKAKRLGFSALALTTFLGSFALGLLAADLFLAFSLMQQLRATSFPSVKGRILHSEIVQKINSDEYGRTKSYRTHVRYEYEVQNQHYEKHRIRYSIRSAGRNYAQKLRKEYPPNKHVTVYYNPRQPADSLLRPGIEGADLFLLLFLTPFNLAVLLGFLYWKRKPSVLPDSFEIDSEIHLPLGATDPLLAGLTTLLMTSILSIFIVGFISGPAPSIPFALLIWFLNLAFAVWLALRFKRTNQAGWEDLIIDQQRSLVLLPWPQNDKEGPQRIPLADVQSVSVETFIEISADSDKLELYAPIIHWQDSASQRMQTKVGDNTDQETAEAIAAWLKAQLARLGIQQAASP